MGVLAGLSPASADDECGGALIMLFLYVCMYTHISVRPHIYGIVFRRI